ncbi:hypothetical protein SNEBB_008460 [Seison nebaliae]|nr:hypothetical protein SNEBB_008460 [Seison nebaliae]
MSSMRCLEQFRAILETLKKDDLKFSFLYDFDEEKAAGRFKTINKREQFFSIMSLILQYLPSMPKLIPDVVLVLSQYFKKTIHANITLFREMRSEKKRALMANGFEIHYENIISEYYKFLQLVDFGSFSIDTRSQEYVNHQKLLMLLNNNLGDIYRYRIDLVNCMDNPYKESVINRYQMIASKYYMRIMEIDPYNSFPLHLLATMFLRNQNESQAIFYCLYSLNVGVRRLDQVERGIFENLKYMIVSFITKLEDKNPTIKYTPLEIAFGHLMGYLLVEDEDREKAKAKVVKLKERQMENAGKIMQKLNEKKNVPYEAEAIIFSQFKSMFFDQFISSLDPIEVNNLNDSIYMAIREFSRTFDNCYSDKSDAYDRTTILQSIGMVIYAIELCQKKIKTSLRRNINRLHETIIYIYCVIVNQFNCYVTKRFVKKIPDNFDELFQHYAKLYMKDYYKYNPQYASLECEECNKEVEEEKEVEQSDNETDEIEIYEDKDEDRITIEEEENDEYSTNDNVQVIEDRLGRSNHQKNNSDKENDVNRLLIEEDITIPFEDLEYYFHSPNYIEALKYLKKNKFRVGENGIDMPMDNFFRSDNHQLNDYRLSIEQYVKIKRMEEYFSHSMNDFLDESFNDYKRKDNKSFIKSWETLFSKERSENANQELFFSFGDNDETFLEWIQILIILTEWILTSKTKIIGSSFFNHFIQHSHYIYKFIYVLRFDKKPLKDTKILKYFKWSNILINSATYPIQFPTKESLRERLQVNLSGIMAVSKTADMNLVLNDDILPDNYYGTFLNMQIYEKLREIEFLKYNDSKSSTSSDAHHQENLTRSFKIYLVVDHLALIYHLPKIIKLLRTKKYHLCIPYSVVRRIDMIKNPNRSHKHMVMNDAFTNARFGANTQLATSWLEEIYKRFSFPIFHCSRESPINEFTTKLLPFISMQNIRLKNNMNENNSSKYEEWFLTEIMNYGKEIRESFDDSSTSMEKEELSNVFIQLSDEIKILKADKELPRRDEGNVSEDTVIILSGMDEKSIREGMSEYSQKYYVSNFQKLKTVVDCLEKKCQDEKIELMFI